MMLRDSRGVAGPRSHARFERTEDPFRLALDPEPLPPGGAVARMRVDNENRSVAVQESSPALPDFTTVFERIPTVRSYD